MKKACSIQNRFIHFELRTTDITGATQFYEELVGPRFWSASVSITQLPEAAIARGARPHWLGHMAVSDADGVSARITEQGGQQLGATGALRDPYGALLSLTSNAARQRAHPVAWHVHHSQDQTKSLAFYSALFGWVGTRASALSAELGDVQTFAWNQEGPAVGCMTSGARLPHIHAQWLYFFRVINIEAARAQVTSWGGLPLETERTPMGDLVAVCDDPHGAAFGLYQSF